MDVINIFLYEFYNWCTIYSLIDPLVSSTGSFLFIIIYSCYLKNDILALFTGYCDKYHMCVSVFELKRRSS